MLAWRGGNIARSAKSIYIAADLGNKKISFPFSPHHPSYNKHRNLISRIRIRTVVGFFSVQSNGASVVGKGKEEKFNFLTK
jgi:hypothetical protein